MCGLGGILRITSTAGAPAGIPESWLDALDAAMRHRGPDGCGRFRDSIPRPDGSVMEVALVHRRLSIIDHDGGAQPMVRRQAISPQNDRRIAVVFNGCIYNHAAIRADLLARGATFDSHHADTECLVHLWADIAPNGIVDQAGLARYLRTLDGMFAAAIWDSSAGSLALIRDPFGEKPLYWTSFVESPDAGGGQVYAFCSSVPGMMRLRSLAGAAQGSVEEWSSALVPWVRFGWSAVRALPGIHEAPPGGVLLFGTQAGQAPGSPAPALPPSPLPLDSTRAESLLRESVSQRLQADVPVGLFLSSGVDSPLLAALARQINPSITAFTVRMPAKSHDESVLAGHIATHLGLKHEILDCNPDPASDLVTLIRQIGLPFGDSSLLPSHWVSRAARSAVKVAISGDGGDELFLGYDRHRAVGLLAAMSTLPAPLRRIGAWVASVLPGRSARAMGTRAWRLACAAACKAPDRHAYQDLVSIFPELLGARLGLPEAAPTSHSPLPGGREAWMRRAIEFDRRVYLTYDLLRKSDTASMAAALEVRSPFLARDIVAAVAATPIETLMPRGRPKALLRQALRRHLPARLVDRPKSGFAIPIGEWFRSDYGGLRQLLYDTLTSSEPFSRQACPLELNTASLRRLLEEHDAAGHDSPWSWRGRDHTQRLYMLLVLALWSREASAWR